MSCTLQLNARARFVAGDSASRCGPQGRAVARTGISTRTSQKAVNRGDAASLRHRRCGHLTVAAGGKSGPLAHFMEKVPWLETAIYIAFWYFLNVQFNLINKRIYNFFPFPWFVSCVHLGVGIFIMAAMWATKVVPYEAPKEGFLKKVALPSAFHAIGHCVTNVSFATVAVSFTHTIKTLEPVFSSIGSYIVNGTVYAWPVYAALVPIMAGVGAASLTELSFTWLGFSTAMLSNALFAARAIYSKALMGSMSPINLYNMVTIISLGMCIPFMLLFEGSTLVSGIKAAAAKVGADELTKVLIAVGFYYHMYNTVAYMALGKLDAVSHAVANVGKRIFVIGFSIVAFGNKITAQTAIGSGIAVLGAFLYSYIKAKDSQMPTESAKEEQPPAAAAA